MIARITLAIILVFLFVLTTDEEFGAVIYVPKGYNGEPTPILYWLHWYRGNAYACPPMLEKPNFIIVAPKFDRNWKDFNLVGLIKQVEQKYPISERYIEGYSRGAYGAAYHAAQNLGVFREVRCLAGAYPDFPQVTDPIKLYAGAFDNRWKHSTIQYAENLGVPITWVDSTHNPFEFYDQLSFSYER